MFVIDPCGPMYEPLSLENQRYKWNGMEVSRTRDQINKVQICVKDEKRKIAEALSDVNTTRESKAEEEQKRRHRRRNAAERSTRTLKRDKEG